MEINTAETPTTFCTTSEIYNPGKFDKHIYHLQFAYYDQCHLLFSLRSALLCYPNLYNCNSLIAESSTLL